MEKNISDDNDPEYWNQMAEIIGNPVPEFEDDSDEVDENGVYHGKPDKTSTSFEKRVEILAELYDAWGDLVGPGFPQKPGRPYSIDPVPLWVRYHLGLSLAFALEAGYISKNTKVEMLVNECFDFLLSELQIKDTNYKNLEEVLN
jgi:hypothetical protein